MEAHRLTAIEEISGYCQCWENDGSHVLGQRRRDTHSLRSQREQQWRVRVMKMCYERSFFQHCVKNGPKRLRLCSFITTTLLLVGWLVFTSFSTTTTLKLFLMLRTHLTSHLAIFGCFQQWRTLFVVAHFQVVPLLQQRFSSGQNEPLKKRLLRPCNRSVSVVKNVYVYRVITLRNDCSFCFLWWVVFFLNKLGDLRTWTHDVHILTVLGKRREDTTIWNECYQVFLEINMCLPWK